MSLLKQTFGHSAIPLHPCPEAGPGGGWEVATGPWVTPPNLSHKVIQYVVDLLASQPLCEVALYVPCQDSRLKRGVKATTAVPKEA